MDTVILARVEDFCTREGLLQPGAPLRLAAAVSGGADSMALLLLLRQLQPRFGYTLSACHVNHGLRGQSADQDEAFVQAECARLGVPLRVFHAAELVPPPVHAGEDWARRLRYTAFAQLQGQGIDAIATAHTANDQAETLLLRLARGTGLHGAGGIRPRRGCYLRPLLCLSRAETEAVCRAEGQPWVTDETNDTDAYARNRLRHSALPALESTNAAAVQNLARFCEKAARADVYLAAGAAKLLAAARLPGAEHAWQLAPLQAAAPLLLETALHSLVAPVRDAEEKYVQLLCAVVRQGSGAVQLTGQVRFCVGNGCLRQEMLPDALPRQLESAPQQVPFLPEKQPEFRLRGGWKGKAELLTADFEKKIQVVHKKDLKNRADYARITTLYTSLVLRARQPGDRFRPAGRGLSKPLRKWMNEAGVPNELRDTLPLLASGSEILWVCGEGFADGLAPDTESRWILHLDAEIETQEEKQMSMHDDIKTVLVSEEQLKAKVAELGAQISRDYAGKNLVLVSILKGSVVFMADLMRAVSIPCNIDFMVVSSYGGSNTTTSGLVKIIKDLDGDLSGKDVLIVEDILDTGVTLSNLVPMLKMRNPNSVKICTILDKPSRRKADIQPDYEGFQVPDEFVVGYGLDYDEKYRNLPYVGVLKPEVYTK